MLLNRYIKKKKKGKYGKQINTIIYFSRTYHLYLLSSYSNRYFVLHYEYNLEYNTYTLLNLRIIYSQKN